MSNSLEGPGADNRMGLLENRWAVWGKSEILEGGKGFLTLVLCWSRKHPICGCQFVWGHWYTILLSAYDNFSRWKSFVHEKGYAKSASWRGIA